MTPPAAVRTGDVPDVANAKTIHYVSFVLVAVYVLAALIFLFSSMGHTGVGRDRAQAAAFGIGMVAIGLMLLHVLDSTVGLFRPLISNGRFSTSLTQLGLWTIAAGTGFAYLLGLTIFGSSVLDDVMPAGTWDDYLILLGGPFAAAVLAKGIVTYKVDNGMMQATTPQQSQLSQVATNEQGQVDLVDSQYLLFNVIALGYFVFKLLDTNQLPPMPGALLALTSSTAGLYVANKAAIRNAPTITSVSPKSVEAGKVLTIRGANFMPDGEIEGRVVSVNLTGHTNALYETLKATNTVVQVKVPEDTTPGWQQVEVTSTAAVATLPASILVTAPQTAPSASQIGAAPG